MPKLASIQKCTGCLACVDACKHGAIKIEKKWNLLYPTIDSNLCINCNQCERVCPIVSPCENDYDLRKAKVVAAWSNNDSVRLNAASGGFCTLLSLDTIRRGGRVALCTWKEGRASFILTSSEQDIIDAANSKYVQSDAHGIYKQVQQALREGFSILFIGLPCQVGALKTFLRNKYLDQLTTIELICSAAPSIEAVKIQEELINSKLLRFRYKDSEFPTIDNYNLLLQKERSTIVVKRDDRQSVFYPIFASLLTARISCLNCQFATTKRVADYTVGDFHGYQVTGSEKGVTLVVCKNAEAYDKLKEVPNLEYKDSTIKKALVSNYRLYTGWDALRYHPAILFRSSFNKLSNKIRYKFLINNYPYRFLWVLFKILTKINIKLVGSKEIKKYDR